MEKPYLLHMFTPVKNVSPFDVNMAYDAGWAAVIPYTGVDTDEVAGLVQDAIFSRGPKAVRRTGVFIGGRDIHQAVDMLEAARGAMVPPFEVSVFADPSGAFTTGAAMVAKVEACLRERHGSGLADQRVLIFGGTGPVGTTAALLAARAGAHVTIVGHSGIEAPRRIAALCAERYGVDIEAADGSTAERKRALLQADAQVVLATAKAGVQVVDRALLAEADALKVVADVNAVPPPGIEGVAPQHDAAPVDGARARVLGIGALAVGNVKYRTQRALLERMREAQSAQYLSFEAAFEVARAQVE